MKTYLKSAVPAGIVAALFALGGVARADLLFPVGKGDFNWDSYNDFANANDFKGEQLTVFGPWLGPDQEMAENVLAYFAAAANVDVKYVGSDSFEQQIVIDAQAGSAPNIAIFPQPGLMADMARKGFLTPLGQETADWLTANYAAGESWVDLASAENAAGETGLYAFPYKIDLKSLVWYVPENFEDMDYDVPETMEELKELTEQMVEDGETPWCIGLGSGSATGWPATDWVEDMMLRTQPAEVYDQWVANEIPFNDPKVIEAVEEFGYFARNDDHVAGGASAVASTDFRDSPKGLFDTPAQCMMHRQASFIPAFFPEDAEVGEDVDFFYFPSYASKDLGKPVLGAGTMFSITKDSPVARAFIEFLKTPIAHEVWMAQKAFLTPFTDANTDLYANDALRGMGEILLEATTFRFDASDLMPGGVGAGSFWTGMVDYTSGKSAEDVTSAIQDSWDNLKK